MKVFDIIIVAESRKYRETGQGWSSLVLFVVYLVMKKNGWLVMNVSKRMKSRQCEDMKLKRDVDLGMFC